MKSIFFFQARQRRFRVAAIIFLLLPILSLTIVWQSGQAQQTQLSLTDILIALRSKKATLVKKNEILTEAVNKEELLLRRRRRLKLNCVMAAQALNLSRRFSKKVQSRR
ncbi:MAG: hypothetical protein M3Q33_05410 [Acidobacteriota bacterium]|nr:hypothetical protein [Acidobacteriota bacterium]